MLKLKNIGYRTTHPDNSSFMRWDKVTQILVQLPNLNGREISPWSSYDVYVTRGMMVLVGWGYNDHWVIYFPRGGEVAAHCMTHDEMEALKILPNNWEIPF